MSKLWILVAGLGLVYLLMWMAVRGDTPPNIDTNALSPGQLTSRPETAVIRLEEEAKGRTIGRTDSAAELTIEQTTEAFFVGQDLKLSSAEDPAAQRGFIIRVKATKDGKPIARFVYHAVAPNTVQLISQS